MPQAAPGGPVNAANLNFEGLDQVENVVGTDLVLVAIGAGRPNAFATITQVLAGVPPATIPDPLLLDDGSAVAPTFSFTASPGTGAFSPAADQYAIAVGGVERWNYVGDLFQGFIGSGPALNNVDVSSTVPTLLPNKTDPNTGIGLSTADQMSLIAGGVRVANLVEAAGVVQFIVPAQNNAAAPSIAFGDGDTGFYEVSDDTVGFASVGTKRFEFSGNNIRSAFTNGPVFKNVAASSTVPTLIPDQSDENTGIGHTTIDQLALIAGGLTCMSVSESAGARQIGFYDGSPIPLQTGVAVTTSAVHAALVSLRLITA